jgi:hypothetical protein
MTADKSSRWRIAVRRVAWTAGVLTLMLGMWALRPGFGEGPEPQHWVDALITTLQFFVLGVPAKDLNWPGRLAALLGPVATSAAVIIAFGERARRTTELTWLRWRPASDVFIGGGELAAGIAMRRHAVLKGAGGKIVGMDRAEESALARAMEGFRIPSFMHAGDALSTGALEPLQLHAAERVWIATGHELRNLEVARRVRATIAARAHRSRKDRRTTRLLVSVRERHLIRAKDSLYPVQADAERVEIEFFSVARLAARGLLLEHPPSAEGADAVHILVTGSGEYADALVVHSAQHLVQHDDPAQCVRITWVSMNASDALRRLRRRFPALAAESEGDSALARLLPLARIDALDRDPGNLMPADWQALQRTQPFSVVYVVDDRDIVTVNAALRAAALRDLTAGTIADEQPIVACLHQAEGSICSMSGPAPDRAGKKVPRVPEGVRAFDVFERCFSADEHEPGERQDRRAMVLHAIYRRTASLQGLSARRTAAQDALSIASLEWRKERSEDFRWSSRMAADHVDIKLDLLARRLQEVESRNVGQSLTGAGGTSRMSDALKDWRHLESEHPGALAVTVAKALAADGGELRRWLARLEHRRFVAERLLEGWLPSPVPQPHEAHVEGNRDVERRKRTLRLNATLKPFDELSRSDQQADFDMVDAIPLVLQAMNPPAP